MENDILTYNHRIKRNQIKIRHHKIYFIMALVLFLIVNISKLEIAMNNYFLFLILFFVLWGNEILAIYYHKWWIKKWRLKLTELTGRDYTRLDSLEDSIITKKDFEIFSNKYIKDTDIVLLNQISNAEKLNITSKLYLVCLDTTLNSWCEMNGILNTCKIKDLPYLKQFCKKRLAKVK